MITRNESYTAAMPNLNLTGLSENWLLKECGHQHWLALAEHSGLDEPRFQDVAGNTVYAAFIGVRVTEARLQNITEHDGFVILTQLVAAGAARHYSRHQVMLNGQVLCRVQLLSTLVNRAEAGNNQSVARAVLGSSDNSCNSESDEAMLQQAAELRESCKVSQRASVLELFPDLRGGIHSGEIPEYRFSPSPMSDFNGADFLYFANFQDIADRADWSWQAAGELWQTRDRFISYYGNINLGDELILTQQSQLESSQEVVGWVRITRASDHSPIADIVTHKQLLAADHYRWANVGGDHE